jgi:UDP-N-acetylmuramate dehydrogenase
MNAGTMPRQPAGELRRDEPMSRHTSWRVGGPADLFFRPASVDDLGAFLRELDPAMPVYWVGLGSNLLVRDGGIRGAVITTTGLLAGLEREGETGVRAEAGVPCTRLARRCARWGLGPSAWFSGIPGTVGGALTMNAGAFGGETWDRVVRVETLSRAGELAERTPADYEIGYRSVRGPADEWFIAAHFDFEPENEAGIERLNALVERRKATQPIGLPSCGSVFRNPPGDHAARLIEAAGLKGRRIGGAVVSEKHANFIINDGGASAADIEALIDLVQTTVAREHGVRLRHEVRMLGEAA